MAILESSLAAGVAQVMAIRIDWAKWRQFFRGMDHPMLERIFTAGESQDPVGSVSDLHRRLESAAPEELEGLILQAVRQAVSSVLRVKPETLRDDQPLTDLGLDSLMGVEIENAIESSLGVSLPPASLLRARTIGHIVSLIAEHVRTKRGGGAPPATITRASTPGSASADEVNLEALSNEEIDDLLDDAAAAAVPPESKEREALKGVCDQGARK
jgi:acyl carrier protein